MAGKDIITMRQGELKRLHVIRRVLDKRIKQTEAAKLIELCNRQVRRVVKRVKEEGDKGIIHKLRGKRSNNKILEETKIKVVSLYKEKYKGFGPLLFSEKLFDIEKIKISDETVRKWLIEAKEWTKERKHKGYRQWRERKSHIGEMIQVDGSHHAWFEERGLKCVLMGYIDDASSRVFARFYEYEGTYPFMDSFKRYIHKYGLPYSIYIDKHTTYKSTRKLTVEDELNNIEPLSEVGRALKELEVEVIYAHSPQAKGRIERLFRTFQDRLIKEMRLKGIKNIQEGNEFLRHYMPVYNKRFEVKAKGTSNLHRKMPVGIKLTSILCKKRDRVLRNDFTITHDCKLYQIKDYTRAKKVTVEERLNGKIHVTYKGKELKYKEILQRPENKEAPKTQKNIKPQKKYMPPKDHPWRIAKISSYPQSYPYQQKEKRTKKEKGLLLTV
jgi:hypothetical protein|tara:strand:+ start:94 stop:1416 length:1323 start_codon:yes stop_codon:yes gene_type:complete